jgi:hypothetical protein
MSNHRYLLTLLVSILGLFPNGAQASPEADFWTWFQKNEATLFDFERDQEKTFDRLAAEMRKVHPGLTFEFGPKKGNQREFVISAEGIRDVFPKVERLFDSAPSLSRWKVTKFRPRREPMDLQYRGVSVKASSVFVLIGPDGSKAGLTVIIPGYSTVNQKTYRGLGFLILDQALGEYDVATRVGYIEVQGSSIENSKALPLRELPKAFDRFFVR